MEIQEEIPHFAGWEGGGNGHKNCEQSLCEQKLAFPILFAEPHQIKKPWKRRENAPKYKEIFKMTKKSKETQKGRDWRVSEAHELSQKEFRIGFANGGEPSFRPETPEPLRNSASGIVHHKNRGLSTLEAAEISSKPVICE